MANPMKAETVVELDDGRTVTMVFDVNAWIDIGDQLGMEVPEIIKVLQDEEKPPSLKMQRVIIWGALRKHHPEMSLRDAGEILAEAAEAMSKALAGGMPQQGEGMPADGEAGPPKAKRGAGTGSTRLGAG